MNWSSHLRLVENRFLLLYWTLLYVVSPIKNLPLDYHFACIFPPQNGLGGDPGWDIDIVIDVDGHIYYDITDMDGYIEDPLTIKRYSEANFRSALKETLLQVALQFPERAREAYEVISKWAL